MTSKNQSISNVWLYFLLTFVYSWLLWLPFVLSGFGVIELSESMFSWRTPAVALGAFGPLLSAVVLTANREGREGLRRYFRKTLSFQIKARYYAVALLLPFLIAAAAHYIVNLSGIDLLPASLFPEDLPVPATLLLVPYFIFIMIAGGGQEEFGWRGYAQDPLQKRFGITKASVLIGVVWGIWHLPLWFMPGEGHQYYSFFGFFIMTVSSSVILGWMYNASGKKMVIPWIMHGASNVSVPVFPILHLAFVPQPGYWVWAGLNVLVAVGMSVYMIKRTERNQSTAGAA